MSTEDEFWKLPDFALLRLLAEADSGPEDPKHVALMAEIRRRGIEV